eukprot:CAMPEP_0182571496 /NCGR_PEP_ID=MMETSP1324-20130603/13387_1 /TAXON_ID=236786 /ORGANISM="Florenciella sp., Strain RCC1587" /LENGTH=554 /DNA_ID=CAMNT_0024786117 /DNA_START=115 /DNA_END=1776 /DNA_ORIENTATION=-
MPRLHCTVEVGQPPEGGVDSPHGSLQALLRAAPFRKPTTGPSSSNSSSDSSQSKRVFVLEGGNATAPSATTTSFATTVAAAPTVRLEAVLSDDGEWPRRFRVVLMREEEEAAAIELPCSMGEEHVMRCLDALLATIDASAADDQRQPRRQSGGGGEAQGSGGEVGAGLLEILGDPAMPVDQPADEPARQAPSKPQPQPQQPPPSSPPLPTGSNPNGAKKSPLSFRSLSPTSSSGLGAALGADERALENAVSAAAAAASGSAFSDGSGATGVAPRSKSPGGHMGGLGSKRAMSPVALPLGAASPSVPLRVTAHRPGDGAVTPGVERINSQRTSTSPAEITLTPTPHGPMCRVRQLRVALQRHGNACGYHCVHNLSLLLQGQEGLRQDLLDEKLVWDSIVTSMITLKAEAERSGRWLTQRLEDATVDEQHIRYLVDTLPHLKGRVTVIPGLHSTAGGSVAYAIEELHRRGRTGGVGGSAAGVFGQDGALSHGFILGATTHWVAALLVRRVSGDFELLLCDSTNKPMSMAEAAFEVEFVDRAPLNAQRILGGDGGAE